jgi:DNA-binding NtrC family response regulator
MHGAITYEDVKEFIDCSENEICFSHSTLDSILHLSSQHFDKVVVSMKEMNDAGILKFINDYYPRIKVIVIANKTFNDLISVFHQLRYSVINEPLEVSGLNKQFANSIGLN